MARERPLVQNDIVSSIKLVIVPLNVSIKKPLALNRDMMAVVCWFWQKSRG